MIFLKRCFKTLTHSLIRKGLGGGLSLLFLLFSFSLTARHPFHTSVTELFFNAKEKSWEVSIKLFQDDLETTLTAYTNRPFKFSFEKEADKVIEAYLRKHFGVQVNKVLQTPYRYLGFETQNDAIWVYLEIPTDQDLSGVYLENSLLIDSFEDQTNLVQVAKGEQKKSFLFQKNKSVQQITW